MLLQLICEVVTNVVTQIWNTSNFEHLASIYSLYDIGDVFCISYSSRLETVYLGAQNTSIQAS